MAVNGESAMASSPRCLFTKIQDNASMVIGDHKQTSIKELHYFMLAASDDAIKVTVS